MFNIQFLDLPQLLTFDLATLSLQSGEFLATAL